MRLLLDTHIVLWSLSDDARLKPAVRSHIVDAAHTVLFSHASIWEISIKLAQGRLRLPGGNMDSLLALLKRTSITLLPIRLRHLRRAAVLPFHHGDPFDRLMAAQAIAEGLQLVTVDPMFRLYRVNVFPV